MVAVTKPPANEVFGKMFQYQQIIGQPDYWLHVDDAGYQQVQISTMSPQHAVSALHKLARWLESVYESSTVPAYEKARAEMFASPLAAALIEQALGEFYVGRYLHPTEAEDDTPLHLDDVVAPRHAPPSVPEDIELAFCIDTVEVIGRLTAQQGAYSSVVLTVRGMFRDVIASLKENT